MPLWVAALVVCLLGAAAGIAYAVWRALQLWRGAKRTLDVLGAGGGTVTDGIARLTESSARLAEAPGRMGVAGAELQRSVAVASYVASSAAEARESAAPVLQVLRRGGRKGRRRPDRAAPAVRP